MFSFRPVLVVIAGGFATVFGIVTVWCVLRALQVEIAISQMHGFFCSNCYEAATARLGLTEEQTIPLGILSGGCALVAAIHSIRLFNRASRCMLAPRIKTVCHF